MLVFDENNHTYTLNGKVLISTTQLLSKVGLAPSYEGVDKELLSKSAERGKLVHKEIETYIKTREIGWSDELHLFIDFVARNGDLTSMISELIVHNEHIAGTIDFLYRKNGITYIADFKTTFAFHTNTVEWQLSIYAYLYDKENYEKIRIQGFHFADGELEIINLRLKPKREIEKLIIAYINGDSYQENDNLLPIDISMELERVENEIIKFENELKTVKQKEAEILEKIKKVMEENGVNKCTCGKATITYFAPSEKTVLDTTKLKKDMPEIYQKYSKKTANKSYIKIKIKEEKTNE